MASQLQAQEASQFVPGIDLVQHALDYVGFLNATKAVFTKLSKDKKHLRRAIWRYETIWIPILGKYQDSGFDHVPPMDVHFMLHVHILYGKQMFPFYQHGHLHWLSMMRPMRLMVPGPAADDPVHRAWLKSFPQEPYIRSYEQDDVSDNNHLPESSLTFAFGSIMEYVRPLMEVVGLPHFKDRAFIIEATERYTRYMESLKDCPPAQREYASMPLDVQVVWFAHRMAVESYDSSVNHFLYNPPSIMDVMRTSQGHISKVKVMWDVKYSEEYTVPGAKLDKSYDPFRLVEFISIPDNLKQPVQDQFCDICINNVRVSDTWTRDKHITVEMRRMGETSFTYISMFKVATTTGQLIPVRQVQDVGKVKFDLRNHRGFEIIIHGKSGRCCASAEVHVGTVFWDPRKAFDGEPVRDGEVDVIIPRIYKSDPKVQFGAKFKLHKLEIPVNLSLLREPFNIGRLDEDLSKLVHKLSLWYNVDLEDEEAFSKAKHSVHMRPGQLALSCEVYIHNNTDLAAVVVKQNGSDYLVSSAYIVGEDILPSYLQVTSDCPISLDLAEGELAMLIRNIDGIWGVCTIKQDLKKGMGFASVMFYQLDEDVTFHTSVQFQDQTTFSIGQVTVDIQTGRFTLAPGCRQVAEYCTLGFCVGVLYVLLHGRRALPAVSQKDLNKDFNENRTKSLKAHYARTRSAKQKLSFSQNSPAPGRAMTLGKLKMNRRKKKSIICTMLLACGLQQTDYAGSQRSSLHSLSSLPDNLDELGEDNDKVKSPQAELNDSYGNYTKHDGKIYSKKLHPGQTQTQDPERHTYSKSDQELDNQNTLNTKTNGRDIGVVEGKEDSAIGTENEEDNYPDEESIIFIEHL